MRVLEVHDLHARYGGHQVLKGVSLSVSSNEWFCLLGPNGAGKTTLLDCIATRLQAESGDIRIAEQSLETAPAAAKRQLGYACAPELLPGLLTGRQCLEVYAIAKQLDSIDEDVLTLARDLHLSPLLDLFVDTYSLGTRQKLCILLSLLGDPKLVLLDEAFNGLDPGSALVLKRHLRERLANGRCGVLLATHSLDIVQRHADTVGLLIDGRISSLWTGDEIDRLKTSSEDALESAIAVAADAASAAD